jgi:hypothetical protein
VFWEGCSALFPKDERLRRELRSGIGVRKMPTPKMHPVESSAVARIGYDSEMEEAFVEYLDGDLYAYEGVPPDVFEALANAESKGTFVNAMIKEYPFREIVGRRG